MDSQSEDNTPPAPKKSAPRTEAAAKSDSPPPTPKKLTRAEILEKARAKAKEAHARKSAKSREAKELKAMQEKADELEATNRRRALEARLAKLEKPDEEVDAMEDDEELPASPPAKKNPKPSSSHGPKKRVRIEKEASPEEDSPVQVRHVAAPKQRVWSEQELMQLEQDRAAYQSEIMRLKDETLHKRLFKFLR